MGARVLDDAARRLRGDIHYYLREMAEEFKLLVDVRAFGPGERLVFEPYTREMYEETHRWMKSLDLFPREQLAQENYQIAVVV